MKFLLEGHQPQFSLPNIDHIQPPQFLFFHKFQNHIDPCSSNFKITSTSIFFIPRPLEVFVPLPFKTSCILVFYFIVLYCIVLYCIVLYCIVLYCIVLYCIVLYCIVLYCIVLYCIVLYCIVLYLYCIVYYFVTPVHGGSREVVVPVGAVFDG